MGFDVYGLKPKINKEKPKTLDDYQDKDGFAKWDKMDDKDKDIYFKLQDKYHSDNPGVYFRSNVWWWRTLWDYTCDVCYKILTRDEMASGQFNDGNKISKTKATKMAKAMKDAETNGFLNEYESNVPKETSYPFNVDVAIEFRKFLEESGGIEIC